MHRLAVKLCTVFGGAFAASWHRPVVALAKVETVIDVPEKVLRPVVPGPRSDEDSA